MATLKHVGMYTPAEIVEKHPEVKKWQWDARTVGFLVQKGIIEGYTKPGTKQKYVQEDSFLQLIQYVNNQIDSKKVQTA